MKQTRTRQPLILVAAIAAAFVLAFVAGQLLSGSDEPKSAQTPGKASEVDVGAPAIGSAGASQSLPGVKQPKPKAKKESSTTANTGQVDTSSSAQTNTQQQNTQSQTTQQNNTQQNTQQNTQPPPQKEKPKPPVIEEGTDEGGGTE